VLFLMKRNKDTVNENAKSQETQTMAITMPQQKEYVMYFVKNGNLYGSNGEGTKIEKLESNVDILKSVSPDGVCYLFQQILPALKDTLNNQTQKDASTKTILKNISDKELVIDGEVADIHWSSNSHFVAIGTVDYERQIFMPLYQIVNVDDFTIWKVPEMKEYSNILGLLNNKHLLLEKNLSDSERNDQQNGEILDFDTINNVLISVGKIKLASPLGRLSFDNLMYSYSNTLNLEIFDLNTKQKKEYTNYSDSNQYFVWNTSWSPSNTYVAFTVSGLEDKIGILNLQNGQIVSVFDRDFAQLYPEKNNKEFNISNLNPLGWYTSEKLFVKSEATYMEGEFNTKRSDKYWIYNVNTGQLTHLPWLDDLFVEFINNPN
jgi:WD40 repeat protein